jgi:hypothetical protein
MNFVLQPCQLLIAVLGAANRLINAGSEVGRRGSELHCRKRLDGILRYYYRRGA